MTHDIQDLLNLIKELEHRILAMEKVYNEIVDRNLITISGFQDSWYWDH